MFHVAGGLYFYRDAQGVHVLKRIDARPDAPIVFEAIIDPDSWASVVASVSAHGESSLSFAVARALHG